MKNSSLETLRDLVNCESEVLKRKGVENARGKFAVGRESAGERLSFFYMQLAPTKQNGARKVQGNKDRRVHTSQDSQGRRSKKFEDQSGGGYEKQNRVLKEGGNTKLKIARNHCGARSQCSGKGMGVRLKGLGQWKRGCKEQK